ncbi:MAG: TlpA disulfide reductase family protein [Halobacteriovoraceae bacterium]|nr:TlpA disulfide reductase family protein [Halobacteriovoraceae bacterium]
MIKKHTIKKYLPLLISILIFAAYLGGQVALDIWEDDSPISIEENADFAYYENIFSKLELTTTTSQTIIPSQNFAPIVILNFWASWCGPCLIEFPSIIQMKKHFGDKVLIIGINSDEEKQLEKIKQIEQKYDLNFPNVADKNGKILDKFLIKSIPTSIIFHKGRVFDITAGNHDFNSGEVIESFEDLLEQEKI